MPPTKSSKDDSSSDESDSDTPAAKGSSKFLKIGNVEPKEKFKHPPVAHPQLPQHPFSMLIVAPKGSGKTNLIVHLLLKQYKGYFHRVVVCSPTLENDPKWGNRNCCL